MLRESHLHNFSLLTVDNRSAIKGFRVVNYRLLTTCLIVKQEGHEDCISIDAARNLTSIHLVQKFLNKEHAFLEVEWLRGRFSEEVEGPRAMVPLFIENDLKKSHNVVMECR